MPLAGVVQRGGVRWVLVVVYAGKLLLFIINGIQVNVDYANRTAFLKKKLVGFVLDRYR